MATSDGRDQTDSIAWSFPSGPGNTTQGGYPLEIFPSGCDEKFKCDMCHLILRDPLQGFCGHRFCKGCVEKAQADTQLTGTPARCMACVEDGADPEYIELKPDQMFPDNAVRREMSNVSVVCANQGCAWAGKFKTYPKHHVECLFQPVSCECGKVVPKINLPSHQEKECQSRKINCKHCSEQIMFASKEEHNLTCPKLPIQCGSCKKKKIPRDKMPEHLEKDCPNPHVPCPLGCGATIEKSKMDSHLQTNISTHLAAVVRIIEALDLKIQEKQLAEAARYESRLQVVEQDLQRVASLQGARAGSSQGGGEGTVSTQEMQQRLKEFENLITVLHGDVHRAINAVETIKQQREVDKHALEMSEQKIRTLERVAALKDVAIAEMDIRLTSSELASYCGVLCWKITDFSRKRQEAITGKTTSIYSPAFYTDRLGYKMCARLYPNGDGMGKGSHLSLFFVLMRGNYDALLKFPFKQKVTLMLLDQSGKEPPDHIIDAFRPDPASSSFKRPSTEMNIASGCPLFMQLDHLHGSPDKYIKEDTVFVKVIVDCTGTVSAK